MELTLKELAPYLPYGLRYSFDNYKYWGIEKQENNTSPRYDLGTLVRIGKKEYIYPIAVEWDDPKNGLASAFKFNNDNFKPILRPLSDLTKTIFLFGYGYCTLEEYINGNWDLGLDNWILKDEAKEQREERIEDLPYSVIVELFKLHFDVFGLIDKGLAIDMNSLK